MFETDIRDDYSFLSWFTQQLTAVLIPSLLALVVGGPMTDYFDQVSGFPLGMVRKVVWYAFFVWGIGFYLALLVNRLFPNAAQEGRWVWVVPTFMFLIAFSFDASMSTFPHALSVFFYPGPNGEAWWCVAVITYPTCQAALYSLGMFLVACI